ncbi:MAG TPA: transposase [Chitinophagaceae bacterium]|nr:transposase [Chitinophagaceae bacterium]
MQEQELLMKIVHPNAAGIDIGSKSHWVAVDQNPAHVQEFGVYTRDHQRLIDYLNLHHITTIAMESTGSYWQTLFHALQKAGFEVILVQGGQTKNVHGKKTDVIDCLWIQKLHTLGLLSSSFLLSDYLQTLRTYYAHRDHLVAQMAMYISKMQKALRLMNIRLDIAIRDIAGKTGRAILEAILRHQRPRLPGFAGPFQSQKDTPGNCCRPSGKLARGSLIRTEVLSRLFRRLQKGSRPLGSRNTGPFATVSSPGRTPGIEK